MNETPDYGAFLSFFLLGFLTGMLLIAATYECHV